MIPKDYFKRTYGQLSGRDWIRRISPDDRAALIYLAFAASGYGVNGGKARASTAQRDSRGRFK